MKKMLVTGGTVFVSRYAVEYFVKAGYDVFVLNRNTKQQPEGVTLIEADRNQLGEILSNQFFDVVLDVTAYTEEDVNNLLDALGGFDDYILISSSAVYPEYGVQPFKEEDEIGANKFWGQYGTDKIAAENALLKRVPSAYILRPPYLYGPMNNVYREAFVFDCALQDRKFYLPGEGEMNLQFFHVQDLCRFMEVILEKRPDKHIFNVGNEDVITIKEWVTLCYRIVGKEPEFVMVDKDVEQRNYFSFYNYEYELDVSGQQELMPETEQLKGGLSEALEWYLGNMDKVNKKPYIEYIEGKLTSKKKR